jgi:hypothetical protein
MPMADLVNVAAWLERLEDVEAWRSTRPPA